VLGILERKSGNIIVQLVSNTQQKTLETVIRTKVKEGSDVYTDEWYRHSKDLPKSFNHQIVNHSAKQYVSGKVSVNAVENRWSHLKRMIYGTYHLVSKKHTQRYLDEYTLRNNTRQYSDKDRFDLVLLSGIGKRLTYQQLIN
jgi:transposase-like protein